MEIQKIYLKPLTEVMSEYRPVYPEPYTWESTMSYLLNNPIEKDLVNQLINELKNSETKIFREPINLNKQEIETEFLEDYIENDQEFYQKLITLNENNQNTEIEDKKYDYTIGDGTHRVIASYLYGAEDILVSESSLEENISYLTLSSIHVNGPKLDEEEKDTLFSAVRSIKINEEHWFTATLCVQNNNKDIVYWDNYDKDLDLALISRKVEEKLIEYIPHISFTVDTFLEPWEDEEEHRKDDEIWDEATLET